MTEIDAADERSTLPRSLGPYRVEAEIGSGAMGTVFRATHLRLERTVALKVLRPDTLQDPDAVRRFLREGRAIARLEHPHIVAVYDAGEIDGVYYIAMKLLEGDTLESLLARHGPPSIDRTIRLASQVAAALNYAHGRGVIHRDVKPANIIVGEGDQATLTDFGIAQAVSGDTARSAVLTGTPLYMAPEQIQGAEADGRTDIYALGAVLYELCSGRPPFAGQMMSVMYAHVHSPVPDIRAAAPKVPEYLAKAIERSLAKNPADRFQTAAELSQALALGGGEGAYNPGSTVDVSAPQAAETSVIVPAASDAWPEREKPAEATTRSIPKVLFAIPVVIAVLIAAGLFALSRSGATPGTLAISTVPQGASVTVDGTRRGRAPLRVAGLKSGRHTVVAGLATYVTQSKRIGVRGGATTNTTIKLVSWPTRRLLSVPQAVLATSYTRNSTTHQIVTGPPVTSLSASQAAGRQIYVLAQLQSTPSVLAARDVHVTPGYALYDPAGFRTASPPSQPVVLSRRHPIQVWMGAFRLHGRSLHSGTYTVRILANGQTVKTLAFTLTP